MDTLVLATHSAGKIKELKVLLAPIQCIPQGVLGIPEVAETGLSFIENALIKARHACQYSSYPALSDDSGLVVDALQGSPGIYSARYAGLNVSDEANIQKVLHAMEDIEPEARQAYFYCAMALVRYPEDPTPITAFGRLDGVILAAPRGEHGFGYDPIFFLPNYDKTLAELNSDEKNIISHRALAIKNLRHYLASLKGTMISGL